MKPLLELDPGSIARARGLFSDLDDTLTSGGLLHAEAFRAMSQLHASGWMIILVTGRPAGWCDHFAHQWPITGVVGENGAFYFYKRFGRVHHHYLQTPTHRRKAQQQLLKLARQAMRLVPGARLAADQPFRATDVGLDYCEEVPRLPAEAVTRLENFFRSAGAQVRTSSLHVNAWFGDHDKLTTSKLFLQEVWNCDLEREKDRFFLIGDSPNDEPMFGFFPLSLGVANLRHLADRLQKLPTYISSASGGEGFAEAARLFLSPLKSGL